MLTMWRVVPRITKRLAINHCNNNSGHNNNNGAHAVSLWCDLKTSNALATRRRSRCSNDGETFNLSSPKRLYHTRTTRYADMIQKNSDVNSKLNETDGSAQQQLEQAYNLVSVVEQQGANAEEHAREALHLYERLLTQREHLNEIEQASCYDGMGVCYMKMGDTVAAEKVLRRGLETHPNLAPLWLHLGEVLQLKGQHLEAVSVFSKFIELSKEFYYTTSTQYDATSNAVAYQYTARTQLPYHRTDSVHVLCAALFKRAVSYIRVHEETMALSDLWLIVDTAHSPHWTSRAYLAIAQLARLRGDWHQARNLATKSIDAAAQDSEQSRDRAQLLSQAHHMRAVCYEALEDESRAEQDHVLADFYFRESAFKAS